MATSLKTPEQILEARAAQWTRRCIEIVDDKLDDAKVHAWNALTHRAVDAQDGRQTLRVVAGTRGLEAATKRVREILVILTGRARNSLDGLIRDARAQFYRDSFRLWEPSIPSELRSSLEHTRAGEQVARGLVIHGYDLQTELKGVISDAIAGLTVACTMAAATGTSDRESRDLISGWRTRTGNAIRQQVSSAVSDSSVAIYQMVGRLMVHRDFHAEEE